MVGGGLMVSALDSVSGGPGLRPGWGTAAAELRLNDQKFSSNIVFVALTWGGQTSLNRAGA